MFLVTILAEERKREKGRKRTRAKEEKRKRGKEEKKKRHATMAGVGLPVDELHCCDDG